MLVRAEERQSVSNLCIYSNNLLTVRRCKQEVDTFIRELACLEKDATKRNKLYDLEITPDEWKSVRRLMVLLGVGDKVHSLVYSTDYAAVCRQCAAFILFG